MSKQWVMRDKAILLFSVMSVLCWTALIIAVGLAFPRAGWSSFGGYLPLGLLLAGLVLVGISIGIRLGTKPRDEGKTKKRAGVRVDRENPLRRVAVREEGEALSLSAARRGGEAHALASDEAQARAGGEGVVVVNALLRRGAALNPEVLGLVGRSVAGGEEVSGLNSRDQGLLLRFSEKLRRLVEEGRVEEVTEEEWEATKVGMRGFSEPEFQAWVRGLDAEDRSRIELLQVAVVRLNLQGVVQGVGLLRELNDRNSEALGRLKVWNRGFIAGVARVEERYRAIAVKREADLARDRAALERIKADQQEMRETLEAMERAARARVGGGEGGAGEGRSPSGAPPGAAAPIAVPGTAGERKGDQTLGDQRMAHSA